GLQRAVVGLVLVALLQQTRPVRQPCFPPTMITISAFRKSRTWPCAKGGTQRKADIVIMVGGSVRAAKLRPIGKYPAGEDAMSTAPPTSAGPAVKHRTLSGSARAGPDRQR